MIRKKCQELSQQYFQKCENLNYIQEPFCLSSISQQLKNRDLENQFELIRALTETKRHKMRLRSNNVFENKKNRYPQQVIFNHSRIVLPLNKVQKTNQDGFINANYVLLSDDQNDSDSPQIIMTQGPIQSTIKDLRSMIQTQKIDCVVMLCRLIQNGKNRCSDYLDNLVTNQQKKIEQHIQSKNVFLGQQYSYHEFRHIYYSEWPDKKVPTAINHIHQIIEQIKCYKRILIHCSAGLGRSGVIAAILLILISKQYQFENRLSIFRVVRKMRQYRYGAVQNSQQYKFLYEFFEHLYLNKQNIK